jgi:hypothetical protein
MEIKGSIATLEINGTFNLHLDGDVRKYDNLHNLLDCLDDKTPDGDEIFNQLFDINTKGKTLTVKNGSSLTTGYFEAAIIADLYDPESDCSTVQYFNSVRDFMWATHHNKDLMELLEAFQATL